MYTGLLNWYTDITLDFEKLKPGQVAVHSIVRKDEMVKHTKIALKVLNVLKGSLAAVFTINMLSKAVVLNWWIGT